MRRLLLNLHLWVGLASALLVLVLSITGTLLVFENEIDRALNPALLTVTPRPDNLPLAELLDSARAHFAGRPILNIGISPRPDLAWQLIVAGKQVSFAYLDPHTGRVTGSRARDASLAFKVHQLHTNLLQGKKGEKFVGYGTLCLLVLIASGVILWWKRRLFALSTAASWLRINFDLHNVSGIYATLFLLVVVGTGLLMSFPNALYPVVEKVTGPTQREQPEEPLVSTPLPGVRSISADRAVAIAQSRLPGAQPTFVGLPQGPNAVYEVAFKFPEDRTPGGRSRVTVDRYSGEVLWLENDRTAPRGVRIANRVRPLHTGDIFGWPSRVVYALASFCVVLQAVTGIIIWSVRTFRKKSRGALEMEA